MWLIKKMGENTSDYEIIRSDNTGELYFAFNKSVSDAVVKAHQEALDNIKNNTSLMKNINDKYLK